MSYAQEHPVTCLRDGCPGSFPGSRHGQMRASRDGWFFPQDRPGRGWCPEHVPEWVADWRARKAAGD